MSQSAHNKTPRREFLKNTGRVAAASTLAASTLTGKMIPKVYAAEDNAIRAALVGCGGRGTGAAANATAVGSVPVKLVAMADVFENRLTSSHALLKKTCGDKCDVPEDRKFTGFDAYRKAMDCLRPGDVVILATPPAFRWLHFGCAIEKGIHVFMEKPTTVDGPSTRKMLALADQSEKKNLKVGVGLMWRHCAARRELAKRIREGQLGEISMMRSYRMHGPLGSAFTGVKPADISEVLYQIKRFHAFLWASGGCYSDFLVHNIDECCWMKDAWPVEAKACGGRHFRGDYVDQNFDSYAVEYTFADGAKLFMSGRTVPGCYDEFASYASGPKGSAAIRPYGNVSRCSIYKGQNTKKGDLVWAYPKSEPNPYQLEWDHLIDAIRQDKPYNEARRGAEASLVTSMGRMAAHTGQIVTYDQILNCEHEFAPDLAKMAADGPPPVQPDSDGRYPIPIPGIKKKREY